MATQVQLALMLFGNLLGYTFPSLLVNWSVIVRMTPQDEYRLVEVAACSNLKARPDEDWFGVRLAHMDSAIFVEKVVPGGLADRAGVLAGDIVDVGSQDGETIFDAERITKDPDFKLIHEVEAYLEGSACNSEEIKVINPSLPLLVRFNMRHVIIDKGAPYNPLSLIMIGRIIGAILVLTITMCVNRHQLSIVFTRRTFNICALPSIGWALADTCEIAASGRMNAALYGVLSQSRLVGTALCMWVVMGTRQTMLQISILFSLSVVILCYVQLPDVVPLGMEWNGFGKPVDPNAPVTKESGDFLGFLFAFSKIFISIVAGVVGQKVLQDPSLKELPLYTLQVAIFSIQSLALTIITFLFMWATEWEYGLIGGAPVQIWHCSQDWTDAECRVRQPIDVIEQGYDYRTWAVVLFYTYREGIAMLILRTFDSLVKNLVNSASTITIFFLSFVCPPVAKFNVSKCALIFTIALQIQQYAVAPKPPCMLPFDDDSDGNGFDMDMFNLPFERTVSAPAIMGHNKPFSRQVSLSSQVQVYRQTRASKYQSEKPILYRSEK